MEQYNSGENEFLSLVLKLGYHSSMDIRKRSNPERNILTGFNLSPQTSTLCHQCCIANPFQQAVSKQQGRDKLRKGVKRLFEKVLKAS